MKHLYLHRNCLCNLIIALLLATALLPLSWACSSDADCAPLPHLVCDSSANCVCEAGFATSGDGSCSPLPTGRPSSAPSGRPTSRPSCQPTRRPSSQPTRRASWCERVIACATMGDPSPSRRARWRYFFDRRGHSSSVVNEDSKLTPRGALSLFFHPQSQTIQSCPNNSYQQQLVP
jgi:hypothetical protein